MKRILLLLSFLIVAVACEQTSQQVSLTWSEEEPLPKAISNNAVAAAQVDGDWFLYSFLGLEEGKTFDDISHYAARYDVSAGVWQKIPGVPDSVGRLASTAEYVNGDIYIFGGYTVDEEGNERTTEHVFKYDPVANTYERVADMLLPVEDAVSLVYDDRYVYLVSGWNNTNSVSNVQMYDTQTNSWENVTPYPGRPAFGHAGGIVGNTMVLADGVQAIVDEGEPIFKMSPGSIKGEINPEDPTQISWTRLVQHPGKARYRMAAVGVEEPVEMVVFIGGSDNPYEYNGIGYNNKPAFADSTVFGYRLDTNEWVDLGTQATPSMDHRSVAKTDEGFYIIGGMVNDQKVTDMVQKFTVDLESSN
ncbi:Kelch repeat-containing protein [Gracilimonas mengyeensis]|uniref:N-acetylneuraminic acid mutarotase n=1 Tax=Gracilimonas mengyeensis TaxID=1302730 RepID=A0A521EMP0_9BACT|nr:kelch repeat-containing protein [Gracilimonas mengyeensis]SMO84721.1 N-acetylneuraminic acid mutarotase [Gracilimonas mengyeensis]